MLNVIVNAIFWLIGKVGDIILLPIMSVISLLIPNLSINLDNIFDYLNYGFTYIVFFLKALIIPPACVQMLALVLGLYISIIVGIRTYQLIMRIYVHFKP